MWQSLPSRGVEVSSRSSSPCFRDRQCSSVSALTWQSNGEGGQLFQPAAVVAAEAEPLRVDEHHVEVQIQRKHRHGLGLLVRPLRKRHLQHQGPGVLDAEPLRVMLFHAPEVGDLGSWEDAGQIILRPTASRSCSSAMARRSRYMVTLFCPA
mgnify:CR=1 FL=1